MASVIDKNDICSICREEMLSSDPFNPKVIAHQISNVAHCFHRYCIGEYCKQPKSDYLCPLCRGSIERLYPSVDQDVISDVNNAKFGRIHDFINTGYVSEEAAGKVLIFAAAKQHPSEVAYLLQNLTVSQYDRGEALCAAIQRNRTGIALQILKSGAILEEQRVRAARLAHLNGYSAIYHLLNPSKCEIL